MDEPLVFFFKKDGKKYGAPEESRINFARMKNPEENQDDDTSFVAFELGSDNPQQRVFSRKDLKGIKILDDLKESAPPGWSGTVTAMRVHHKDIKNPYALAWSMYKKHDHPHYRETPNKKSTGSKMPAKKHRSFKEWLNIYHPGSL